MRPLLPFRDSERHLRDILESIDQINEFIGTMDFAAYQRDGKTKAAVERKIQILTEAIIRLEQDRRRFRKLTGKDTGAWATSCGILTTKFLMKSYGIRSRMTCLRFGRLSKRRSSHDVTAIMGRCAGLRRLSTLRRIAVGAGCV